MVDDEKKERWAKSLDEAGLLDEVEDSWELKSDPKSGSTITVKKKKTSSESVDTSGRESDVPFAIPIPSIPPLPMSDMPRAPIPPPMPPENYTGTGTEPAPMFPKTTARSMGGPGTEPGPSGVPYTDDDHDRVTVEVIPEDTRPLFNADEAEFVPPSYDEIPEDTKPGVGLKFQSVEPIPFEDTTDRSTPAFGAEPVLDRVDDDIPDGSSSGISTDRNSDVPVITVRGKRISEGPTVTIRGKRISVAPESHVSRITESQGPIFDAPPDIDEVFTGIEIDPFTDKNRDSGDFSGVAETLSSDPLGLLENVKEESDPVVEMRERREMGDYSGALRIAQEIVNDNPGNEEASKCAQESKSVLLQMYESKIGSMDRVPKLAVSNEEIIWHNLDPQTGFVISQIDGMVTFEDILDISGMSKFETCKILNNLLQDGVIE